MGLLTLGGIKAEASWLIDARKFHISAHGQTPCVDCHGDMAERDFHPNPDVVNKKRSDFFNQEQCLSCHDDVTDNLESGLHGSKKVRNPNKYICIRCHKPHSQPRLRDNRIGNFEPGRPRDKQCDACHELRSSLPAPSPEDKACMRCHRPVSPDDPKGRDQINGLCFHCHGDSGTQAQKVTGKTIPLIVVKEYRSTPHKEIACTTCHADSAQFRHRTQKPVDCKQCHPRHDEKVAHDAHIGVSCGACHLNGIRPVRDLDNGFVLWEREGQSGKTTNIHQMVSGDDKASCRSCHFKGNAVGAASMILPSKSIICMPCHAATFSVGDTTTVFTMIIFLGGLVIMISYWLTGTVAGKTDSGPITKIFRLLESAIRQVFSPRIWPIIKPFILDVFLQRRLYRQSQTRWFVHSLIFWPFVFRSIWGLIGLIGSLGHPESSWVWVLLDKNHPVTALFFDLSGLMVLLGVCLAFFRGILHDDTQLPGLPRQDRIALALIASIVAVGFILEGIRIAMTGRPNGSGYSIVGYLISLAFSEPALWTGVYGYIWYVHAILTGAFVAYVPFSGLSHIILAPVALAIRAISEHKHLHVH